MSALATALLHATAAETGRAVELATTQGPFNLLGGRDRSAAFFAGTLRGLLGTAADKLRRVPPLPKVRGGRERSSGGACSVLWSVTSSWPRLSSRDPSASGLPRRPRTGQRRDSGAPL